MPIFAIPDKQLPPPAQPSRRLPTETDVLGALLSGSDYDDRGRTMGAISSTRAGISPEQPPAAQLLQAMMGQQAQPPSLAVESPLLLALYQLLERDRMMGR